MNYYIQKDSDGFVTLLSKEAQDGFDLIFVPNSWEDSFIKYFDKFRVNEQGVLTNPGNLPTLSLNDLATQLADTQNKQTDTLATLSNLITAQTTLTNGIGDLNVLASELASVMSIITKLK